MSKLDLKSKLSELAFEVTQNSATEPPFSGKYNDFYEDGDYSCVCCHSKLFSSNDKFKSLSGWPSFHSCVDAKAIDLIEDHSLGMIRVEVVCSKCNAHLGHFFDDGPQPTSKRFCINSSALNFEKK